MKRKYLLLTVSILTGVLIVLLASLLIILLRDNPAPATSSTTEQKLKSLTFYERLGLDNPPTIYGIGTNLNAYNPSIDRAGDVSFSLSYEDKTYKPVPFEEFGRTFERGGGLNTHPEFLLPVGTKIHSVSEGVVEDISKLYSNDYSVLVKISPESKWTINYEHVINPSVKKGERVYVDQVLAEVSPLGWPNKKFGKWALMKFSATSSEDDPRYVACPYDLLDESVKSTYEAQLLQLVKDWEKFKKDTTVYD